MENQRAEIDDDKSLLKVIDELRSTNRDDRRVANSMIDELRAQNLMLAEGAADKEKCAQELLQMTIDDLRAQNGELTAELNRMQEALMEEMMDMNRQSLARMRDLTERQDRRSDDMMHEMQLKKDLKHLLKNQIIIKIIILVFEPKLWFRRTKYLCCIRDQMQQTIERTLRAQANEANESV